MHMVAIQVSREIIAPVDKLWEIVSDIDREPQFWRGTKSIKNIKKEENLIEREVVISFRNSVCKQIVTIDPKKSVKIRIIDGPMKGKKTHFGRNRRSIREDIENSRIIIYREILFLYFDCSIKRVRFP